MFILRFFFFVFLKILLAPTFLNMAQVQLAVKTFYGVILALGSHFLEIDQQI